ncbi:hypothetical protein NKH89_35455, partial [Mesorhizobium sp. M0923]
MEIDTDKIGDAVLGLLWLTLHDERRSAHRQSRDGYGLGRFPAAGLGGASPVALRSLTICRRLSMP